MTTKGRVQSPQRNLCDDGNVAYPCWPTEVTSPVKPLSPWNETNEPKELNSSPHLLSFDLNVTRCTWPVAVSTA